MKRIWEKTIDCCAYCPHCEQGVDKQGHRDETTDNKFLCRHEKSAGMVTRYITVSAGCHPKCPLKEYKPILE